MDNSFLEQAESAYNNRKSSSKMGPASNYDALFQAANYVENNRFINRNNRLYGHDGPRSKYLTRYDNPFDPYVNEKLASKQPRFNKFAAGIGRVGSKVLTELNKLPGMAVGTVAGVVGEIIDSDKNSFMDMAFNNAWVQSVNELGEEFNTEVLPVYVKKAVQDGNLWDKISSIDFWATEGADGLGFIISMLVPGMLINKGNLGAKLLGTNKWLRLSGKVDEGASKLSAAGITPKAANLHLSTAANTIFEAGVEAQSAMDSYLEDAERQLVRGEITQEQFEVKKKEAAEVASNVFNANAAILVGPNAIMSKMIWGGARNKTVGSLFDKGKLLAELPKVEKLKLLQMWGDDFGAAAIREGFWEEGMQTTAEQYFTEKPDSNLFDFIGDLPQAYADMISDVEGQSAIFLGAAFGGGMQAYMNSKQRKAERNTTNKLLSNWNNMTATLDKVFSDDVYKKTKTGKTMIRNGKPVIDEAAFVEKLRSLDEYEAFSSLFDIAVQQGDQETVEQMRDAVITHMVKPFIMNDNMGIDVLEQHLKYQEEAIPVNERIDKGEGSFKTAILEKAKSMQQAYKTFESFAPELIKLEHADATEQDKVAFYNQLANQYLNLKSRQEYLNKKAKEVQDIQNQVLSEIPGNNVNADQETIETLKKGNRRLGFINKKVQQAEKSLEQVSEALEKFWDQETIDKLFKAKMQQKKAAEEAVAKTEETVKEIEEVKNIETNEELAKKEAETKNPAVLNEIEKKKKEIATEKKQKVAEAKESNREFDQAEKANEEAAKKAVNNYNVGEEFTLPNGKTGTITNKTNGTLTIETPDGKIYKQTFSPSPVTPAPQPQSKVREFDPKVISQDQDGNKFDWIDQSLIDFQEQPRDKRGEVVHFEINTDPSISKNGNWGKAVAMIEADDFSDMEFLINHLPINAVFTDEAKGPIETLPQSATAQKYFETSKALRAAIIQELAAGTPIEKITTVIAGQDGGSMTMQPITEEGVIEAGIHQLYEFGGDINKVTPDMIYVVNDKGTLVNHKNQVMPVAIAEGVAKDKGMYYLLVTKANGRKTRLRLNQQLITEGQLDLIYDIISTIFDDYAAGNYTKLIELPTELQDRIKSTLSKELEFFKKNDMFYKELTVKDIIDILIYDETGVKRRTPKTDIRFMFDNGKLFVAGKTFTAETMDRDEFKSLLKYKSRNIINKTKKDQPNGLGLNNPLYFKFILENRILNTNAVTDRPLFQGKTTIYLNKQKVLVDGKISKYAYKPAATKPTTKPPAKPTYTAPKVNTDGPQVRKGDIDPITAAFGPAAVDTEIPSTMTNEELMDQDAVKKGVSARFDVSRLQGRITGLTNKAAKPKRQLKMTTDEYMAIINKASEGDTFMDDPFKFGENFAVVTKDYHVVIFNETEARLLMDETEIKQALQTFNPIAKGSIYKNNFSLHDGLKLLEARLTEKPAAKPKKTTPKKTAPKLSDAEALNLIKAAMQKYPKHIRSINSVFKDSTLTTQEKWEKIGALVGERKSIEDNTDETC